jgi:hypothetical protein
LQRQHDDGSAGVVLTRKSGPSAIAFDIGRKLPWDAATNTFGTSRVRSAHVYVFALLHPTDRETIDPLDLSQWTFYVLPAAILDARCPTQKTIRLSSLEKLSPTRASFDELRGAIRSAASATGL